MRKLAKHESFFSVDCHTCCYPDQVKCYFQVSSQKEVASTQFFSEKSKTILENTYLTKNVDVMERKMNQCVSLTDLRLQLSSFHRRKFLQKGTNSQVHKDMFPGHFRVLQRYTQDIMYHFIRKDVRGECSLCVECLTCCNSDQVKLY